MNLKEAEALRDEVEARYNRGENFSVGEIRKMMKRTGLSYAQVVKQTRQLDKDMKKAEKAAADEGKPFNKEAYLSMRRQMAGR